MTGQGQTCAVHGSARAAARASSRASAPFGSAAPLATVRCIAPTRADRCGATLCRAQPCHASVRVRWATTSAQAFAWVRKVLQDLPCRASLFVSVRTSAPSEVGASSSGTAWKVEGPAADGGCTALGVRRAPCNERVSSAAGRHGRQRVAHKLALRVAAVRKPLSCCVSRAALGIVGIRLGADSSGDRSYARRPFIECGCADVAE